MPIPLRRVKLAATSEVAPNKYCAMTDLYPTIENDDVVEYISSQTGIPAATIDMVLKYSNLAYKHYLSIGHPVRMGKLGILKVTCKSKAQDEKEDVSATVKPSFRASAELREAVAAMSTTFTDGGTVATTGDDEVDAGDDSGNSGGSSDNSGGSSDNTGGNTPAGGDENDDDVQA